LRRYRLGEASAEELISRYTAHVYRLAASFKETARRMGLDRRRRKKRKVMWRCGRYNLLDLRVHPAARWLAASLAAALCLALVFAKFRHPGPAPPAILALAPDRLIADGYDTAILSIRSERPPQIFVSGAPGVRVEKITRDGGEWRARIRAGIVSGNAQLRVGNASAALHLDLATRDSAEDGTPDFLRLDDDHDQQAFRRWFTYLAEAQYFQTPAERPEEINDCAALIRYAYREALAAHDGAWAAAAHVPVLRAMESAAKYQYPDTPLASALFRVKPGPFRAGDLSDGAFLQFADAHTLWRYNSYFVSRDLSRALPGDLLFFRQPAGREPFHSMIYLGASQLQPDGKRYVLYHTGPQAKDPGEIKRLTLEDLLRFPQPEWRPIASNPAFLGVSRWNILRRNVE
jgi:uncharacterized protein